MLTRRFQMLEKKQKECEKAKKRIRETLFLFFSCRMKSLFGQSVHQNSIWLLREVEAKLGWVGGVRGCFFPGCSAPAGRSLKEKLRNERKGTSKLDPCHRGPQSDHLQIRQQALIKNVSSPSVPSTPLSPPSSFPPGGVRGGDGLGIGG